MRGIIGPGTGLGNSLLYPAVVKQHKQTLVLPCEGGHTDFPTIDDETSDFFHFIKKEGGFSYVSLERSFCGPAIPFMHRFVSQRFPEDPVPKE
jgi:glucokinase